MPKRLNVMVGNEPEYDPWDEALAAADTHEELAALRRQLRASKLTKHLGPGPHPSGSSQDVHGRKAGQTSLFDPRQYDPPPIPGPELIWKHGFGRDFYDEEKQWITETSRTFEADFPGLLPERITVCSTAKEGGNTVAWVDYRPGNQIGMKGEYFVYVNQVVDRESIEEAAKKEPLHLIAYQVASRVGPVGSDEWWETVYRANIYHELSHVATARAFGPRPATDVIPEHYPRYSPRFHPEGSEMDFSEFGSPQATSSSGPLPSTYATRNEREYIAEALTEAHHEGNSASPNAKRLAQMFRDHDSFRSDWMAKAKVIRLCTLNISSDAAIEKGTGPFPHGPSIKWPKVYEALRRAGMSKEQAAAISNAHWNKYRRWGRAGAPGPRSAEEYRRQRGRKPRRRKGIPLPKSRQVNKIADPADLARFLYARTLVRKHPFQGSDVHSTGSDQAAHSGSARPRLGQRLNRLVTDRQELLSAPKPKKKKLYIAERPDGGLQRLYNPDAWHRPESLRVCLLCGGLVAKQVPDENWIHLDRYEKLGEEARQGFWDRFERFVGLSRSGQTLILWDGSQLWEHQKLLDQYADKIIGLPDPEVQAKLLQQGTADREALKAQQTELHYRSEALRQQIIEETQKVYPEIFLSGAKLKAAINSHAGPDGNFAKPLSYQEFTDLSAEDIDKAVAANPELAALREKMSATAKVQAEAFTVYQERRNWIKTNVPRIQYGLEPGPLDRYHAEDRWFVPKSALTSTGKLKAAAHLADLDIQRVAYDPLTQRLEPSSLVGDPLYESIGYWEWHDLVKSYLRRESHQYNKAAKISADLRDEFQAKLRQYFTSLRGPTRSEAMLTELRKLRPMGGSIKLHNQKGKGIEIAEKWNKYFPSDWIEASNDRGGIIVQVRKGRAHYSAGTVKVRDDLDDWLHEMGHRFEASLPAVKLLERVFYEARTGTDDVVKLSSVLSRHGYKSDEYTVTDEFGHPYMGKRYPDGSHELLSMGLPIVYGASANKMDPEMTDFILGLLVEM